VDGVRRLLEAWPLEGIFAVTEVLVGATNRVYRVDCADRVVYLRVYKRFDRAMAQREHALIRHVRGSGLPAPLPVVACGGESVVERDGQLAALYEAVPGAQIAPGSARFEHARAAGEALASLHQATAALPDVGYTPRTFGWDGAAWVERLNVVESAIRARGDGNPGDAWARRRIAAQREWLRDAACAHSAVSRFPPQVVHGDYHDANLFFEGDRVSGIIDWEQAAFLPRAYEVVRACFFMFRLAPRLSQAFLLAYRSVSELSDAELADGAASWGCNADHHVWPLEEVYLHGNERARRFIPHAPFVPFAQAWRGVVGEGVA
jgi:homoserine kinase type II